MRTRDEVLIDRFLQNEAFTLEQSEDLRDAVKRMADRIRELEAQQAASEPVAVTDEKGSPVIAYMVFDDDNNPVAFAREKDDAEFAVSELSSIEGALRVVACHFTAALTRPTTPTRGSDE